MKVFDVSEPWFSLIAMGLKTVEGRKAKAPFVTLQVGDEVTWINDQLAFRRECRTIVTALRTYTSFKKYLKTETLSRALPAPGINTIKDGVTVYRQFYSREDERRYGVLAIGLILKP